jgi:hypothetical protein
MRTLFAWIALTAVCFAAEEEKRRLESVTWDPVHHQLQWIISKGKMEGSQFKSETRDAYQIDIDNATMSFSDETRRFSKDEAKAVHQLLDVLARYAAESTIWWERGQGEVVKKGERVSLPARRCKPRPADALRPAASAETAGAAAIPVNAAPPRASR